MQPNGQPRPHITGQKTLGKSSHAGNGKLVKILQPGTRVISKDAAVSAEGNSQDVLQIRGERAGSLGIDQFLQRDLALSSDCDVYRPELFQRAVRKRGSVRTSDDSPSVGRSAFHDGARVRCGMNLVRHRGHAEDLWLKLVQVRAQHVVRYQRVLGVENANRVSLLEEVGGKIAESKMPVAAAMSSAGDFQPRDAAG